MPRPRAVRDGLCRPVLSVRPHQLVRAVCTRGGLTCPEWPPDKARAFLAAVGSEPSAAIRLVSDADEVAHYSLMRGQAHRAPSAVPRSVLARKRDLDVLQRLGQCPGDTRRARWLYELLFERIETPLGLCAYDTPGWEGCPHADSGAYERIRAEGWRAIVYSRPVDQMAECRRQSVARIENDDRVFIRPHHLMCMACWCSGGEGIGPRPNDTISEAYERLRRDPETLVTLIEGCCEVCNCCDGFSPVTKRCVHGGGLIRDFKKDLDMFQKLGLAPGATMPARDFVRLMFERIPSTRDICAYGDGVVRSTEWAICGDPDGSPGYARSREKGML